MDNRFGWQAMNHDLGENTIKSKQNLRQANVVGFRFFLAPARFRIRSLSDLKLESVSVE